ncbi:hypothetical protein B0H14DRAFT_3782800 [Mycena olivaceomarginata]|nr:hypothetical protein B0H14DRAFT_3782800 [Mycena olivaceomarginata]
MTLTVVLHRARGHLALSRCYTRRRTVHLVAPSAASHSFFVAPPALWHRALHRCMAHFVALRSSLPSTCVLRATCRILFVPCPARYQSHHARLLCPAHHLSHHVLRPSSIALCSAHYLSHHALHSVLYADRRITLIASPSCSARTNASRSSLRPLVLWAHRRIMPIASLSCSAQTVGSRSFFVLCTLPITSCSLLRALRATAASRLHRITCPLALCAAVRFVFVRLSRSLRSCEVFTASHVLPLSLVFRSLVARPHTVFKGHLGARFQLKTIRVVDIDKDVGDEFDEKGDPDDQAHHRGPDLWRDAIPERAAPVDVALNGTVGLARV